MRYAEHLIDSPVVCCTWERRTAEASEARVVPDACVDLIWTGERLIVAGPDTRARLVRLPAGARLVGARLRPGAAGAVLGLPADELRDMSPDAGDVLGLDTADELLDELAAGADPHALLIDSVARRAVALDALVLAAIAALDRARRARRDRRPRPCSPCSPRSPPSTVLAVLAAIFALDRARRDRGPRPAARPRAPAWRRSSG
jgi:hypothetical protein